MKITIYSKSGCPECVFTKKYLQSKNIPFEEKRIDQDQSYLDEVISLGYTSLPVIKIGQESFSGYQPERLEALVS